MSMQLSVHFMVGIRIPKDSLADYGINDIYSNDKWLPFIEGRPDVTAVGENYHLLLVFGDPSDYYFGITVEGGGWGGYRDKECIVLDRIPTKEEAYKLLRIAGVKCTEDQVQYMMVSYWS